MFTLPVKIMVTWLGGLGRPLLSRTTSPEQRDPFARHHTHARTHTAFILKDSLYSRLHSVIQKAREVERRRGNSYIVSEEKED